MVGKKDQPKTDRRRRMPAYDECPICHEGFQSTKGHRCKPSPDRTPELEERPRFRPLTLHEKR